MNSTPMTRMMTGTDLPEQRHDEDRRDDDRQRQQHVDEPHDDVVGEAAVEAGDEADDAAPEQASRVASGAMMSTVRAPAMVRAKTSRPRSSVPNQWAPLGRTEDASAVDVVGPCVTWVENSAMNTQNSTMTRPAMKVGLRSSAC